MRVSDTLRIRTLPDTVDELAVERPNDVWVKIPRTAQMDDGYRTVSWLQLASAVDRLVDSVFNRPNLVAKGETIAYTGVNDVRYAIVMLAAMKAGCKILLISPRNSGEGQLSLLQSTRCGHLLYSPELRSQMDRSPLIKADIRMSAIPSLQTLLKLRTTLPSTTGQMPPNPHEHVLILHSSGSTGPPKPIYYTQGSVALIYDIASIPAAPGRRHVLKEVFSSEPMLSMMPFFHIMGVMLIGRSIVQRGSLILLPPESPPTPDMIVKAIQSQKPRSAVFAPSMLNDLCTAVGGLQALSKLRTVIYGGAALTSATGDRIAQITNLVNGMGSTETFNILSYVPEHSEDWDYHEWDETAGATMEPAGGDLFELVIKRVASRHDQFVFHNFPDLTEWRTHDLFEPHPCRPGLWRYCGRADDTLVFSNGEKYVPTNFEMMVALHPAIHSALMTGSGRFQASFIVQPNSPTHTAAAKSAVVDQILPRVEEANAQAPAYAQVFRSMIIVTDPDKPLVKNAKGAVMRKASLQLYEREIQSLYAPQAVKSTRLSSSASTDLVDVERAIRHTFETLMPRFTEWVGAHDNFFLLGVDSLLVHRLSEALGQALAWETGTLAPRLIYNNPTVSSLAREVHRTLSRPAQSVPCDLSTSREQRMSLLTHKYCRNFARILPPFLGQPQRHRILLTGSTGALGTEILHHLIQDPKVAHVYCLNRSGDGKARQTQAFIDRALAPHFSHVTFLEVDLAQQQFGVSQEQFEKLQSSVSAIVHNAWPVNFNMSLGTFEPSIAGMRNLVDFSSTALHHPHILFISSIASVGNWASVRPDMPAVPESFDLDNSLPLSNGYGESKHVASAILARACAETGISATVARVGQLAGPRTHSGTWNKAEWLPSLVATSVPLRRLPNSLSAVTHPINWIAIDDAAKAIGQILHTRLAECAYPQKPAPPLCTLNIVHPQPTTWGTLIPTIEAHFARRDVTLQVVPFAEWVEALAKVPDGEASIAHYPALKLLDVFRDMATAPHVDFDTTLVQRYAPGLRQAPVVDDQMLDVWLNDWAFKTS